VSGPANPPAGSRRLVFGARRRTLVRGAVPEPQRRLRTSSITMSRPDHRAVQPILGPPTPPPSPRRRSASRPGSHIAPKRPARSPPPVRSACVARRCSASASSTGPVAHAGHDGQAADVVWRRSVSSAEPMTTTRWTVSWSGGLHEDSGVTARTRLAGGQTSALVNFRSLRTRWRVRLLALGR
jgi:hypothetical protein